MILRISLNRTITTLSLNHSTRDFCPIGGTFSHQQSGPSYEVIQPKTEMI